MTTYRYKRSRQQTTARDWGYFVLFMVVLLPFAFAWDDPPVGVPILAVLVVLAVYFGIRYWRVAQERARQRTIAFQRLASSLTGLCSLTPSGFEAAVGGILRRRGWSQVQHVGRAGDNGADLTAVDPYGRRVVVQCKKFNPQTKVGPGVVRDLRGCLPLHGASRGLLVTTAGFSSAAKQTAQQLGVELWDGVGLVRAASG